MIKIGLLGNSNRQLLIVLQCFQPTGLIGWAIFKIYGEIVLFNTNYAFDGWIVRAPAFLSFFFIKNKKAGPRKKRCEYFILFILLVLQLLLRTDAIPYVYLFIRTALYGTFK